jgi:hypothetical protein
MTVAERWGNDRSLYFEDGDSGSSSDEERYVQTAIDEERKHLSTLTPANFRLFSNLRRLPGPLELPSTTDEIDEVKLDELRTTVRSVTRDVTEVSRLLQDDFGDSEPEKARKQLLLSVLTNGCFYLHLVGSGYKTTKHPALRHIECVKQMLEAQAAKEEEEEVEREQIPEIEERHVPNQLKQVADGGFRAVSRTILSGKVLPPGKGSAKKNPRLRGKAQYKKMKALHDRRVGVKGGPGDGFYHGQLSGISQTQTKSVKLHPAH